MAMETQTKTIDINRHHERSNCSSKQLHSVLELALPLVSSCLEAGERTCLCPQMQEGPLKTSQDSRVSPDMERGLCLGRPYCPVPQYLMFTFPCSKTTKPVHHLKIPPWEATGFLFSG